MSRAGSWRAPASPGAGDFRLRRGRARAASQPRRSAPLTAGLMIRGSVAMRVKERADLVVPTAQLQVVELLGIKVAGLGGERREREQIHVGLETRPWPLAPGAAAPAPSWGSVPRTSPAGARSSRSPPPATRCGWTGPRASRNRCSSPAARPDSAARSAPPAWACTGTGRTRSPAPRGASRPAGRAGSGVPAGSLVHSPVRSGAGAERTRPRRTPPVATPCPPPASPRS